MPAVQLWRKGWCPLKLAYGHLAVRRVFYGRLSGVLTLYHIADSVISDCVIYGLVDWVFDHGLCLTFLYLFENPSALHFNA